MRKIITIISTFCATLFCNAQHLGKIYSKETFPKAGIENQYIYTPPKNLLIPDNISALVVYKTKNQYFYKSIPAKKLNKDSYIFLFKAPDSTSVLIFSIAEVNNKLREKNSLVIEKQKVIDNNNERGFVIYLRNNNGKRFNNEKISLAGLMNDYALYFLNLKQLPNKQLVKVYEESFNLYPILKTPNNYLDYLEILKEEDSTTAKLKLKIFLNQQLSGNINEAKWSNAARVYRILKMNEEKAEIENKILVAFPDGKLAKQKFLNNYSKGKDNTEQTLLESLHNYIARFKDNSDVSKDRFYADIILLLIDAKEWDRLPEYEKKVANKIKIVGLYDYMAWKLVGKQIKDTASDIVGAKILSKKSLFLYEKAFSIRAKNSEPDDELTDFKNRIYETYALILYKLKQYDSAFYYQDILYHTGRELNTGNMERYAAYAEKTKGDLFAKIFIEAQLVKGVKSPVMYEQLQNIYRKLNLTDDELNNVKEKSDELARQISEKNIVATYGSLKAKDFALKNILGETILLSSFKNKVVVLDFWSSWCVPCRASFPAMQQLVDKYKNDSNVVFLFLDVWENKTPEKMQESSIKIMQEGNYSFNVLLDVKDKVVVDYKVDGIPKKFIIDKKGNLIYTGDKTGTIVSEGATINEISVIIESAKK